MLLPPLPRVLTLQVCAPHSSMWQWWGSTRCLVKARPSPYQGRWARLILSTLRQFSLLSSPFLFLLTECEYAGVKSYLQGYKVTFRNFSSAPWIIFAISKSFSPLQLACFGVRLYCWKRSCKPWRPVDPWMFVLALSGLVVNLIGGWVWGGGLAACEIFRWR